MTSSGAAWAEVAFNLPLEEAFTYAIPPGLRGELRPGMLASAHFAGRKTVGCITALRDEPPAGVEPEKILPLLGRAAPEYALNGELMALARFVSEYYVCSQGEALCAASVVGFRDVRLAAAPSYRLMRGWNEQPAAGKLTARQRTVAVKLEELGYPAASKSALAKMAGTTAPTLDRLREAGLLEECVPELPPSRDRLPPRDEPRALHTEQQEALDAILQAAAPETGESSFRVFLLYGITGSGKTEVYLQAMHRVLEAGRTVLCLVPEISLTPQTVERFESRLGESVGVFHSQLTRRAKLILYRRILAGEIRVVIGARSSVFAPLPDLGLVVIDEEHDGSYKQNESPRYHARDTAIMRAKTLGIPVVLGSATPALETFVNAREGKYTLLRLSARASGLELPPVRLIDLSGELLMEGTTSHLSPTLLAHVEERLQRGEQSLLFLNRRGFSNFLFCPSCKWVARCEEDDVSMTVHRNRRAGAPPERNGELDLFAAQEKPAEFHLRCHFCGVRADRPDVCPQCGHAELMTVGAGTQRIEEDLAARFPEASILRLDQDTVGSRDRWMEAWRKMTSGEAQIILGTQMIAKGLHLEGVTLVGVVLADVGLFVPDFRAEERTFSLLTQVAGRAGRTSAGEVLFQTWIPTHTAVKCAAKHDYETFSAEELRRRRGIGFPPYSRLVALTISDPDRDKAFKLARLLGSLLNRYRHGPDARGVMINGPNVAPMSRIAGRFRYRILMRGPSTPAMARLYRAARADRDLHVPGTARIAVDVDPLDLL